jgi:hypothetical protein
MHDIAVNRDGINGFGTLVTAPPAPDHNKARFHVGLMMPMLEHNEVRIHVGTSAESGT